MATNVTMPKLGLTMETGKIVEWKVAQGGEVKQGQILLVVETEKITYEVEAPASGLLNIIVKAEEEVPVAELIAQIAADKAELDALAAGGAPAAAAPPQRLHLHRLQLLLQPQRPHPHQRLHVPRVSVSWHRRLQRSWLKRLTLTSA